MTYHRQQGAALISVLLMFAIITILATQLITRSQADIERTRWLVTEAQAYQYALGGEALARQVLWQQQANLKAEGINISPIPNLLPKYQPEQGQMAIEIIDLQGRINLNNALNSDTRHSPISRIFNDLLLKPDLNQSLSDWLDSDMTPLTGGAEDFHYLALEVPYRTGNQALASSSELMTLFDMPVDEFPVLRPYITALKQPTPININTAPEMVLSLINANLSGQQVAGYRDSHPSGYSSVEEFLTADVMAGVNIDHKLLTVTSTNYAVKIKTTINDRTLWLFSRLNLDSSTGDIALNARTVGERFIVNTTDINKENQDDTATKPLF